MKKILVIALALVLSLTCVSALAETKLSIGATPAPHAEILEVVKPILAEQGIEPTAEDLADIERGEIPSSLRDDEIHGNDIFYRLLAEQVYEKILELGYAEPKA